MTRPRLGEAAQYGRVIDASAVFVERTRYVAEERERHLKAARLASRSRELKDEETRLQRNVGLALGFGIFLVAVAGFRAWAEAMGWGQ
jgi:hypothetical protein